MGDPETITVDRGKIATFLVIRIPTHLREEAAAKLMADVKKFPADGEWIRLSIGPPDAIEKARQQKLLVQ